MGLAAIADVKNVGRFPANQVIPDATITVHLASAVRELTAWIGEYGTGDEQAKQDACKYAECCICIAFLIPVINVTYKSHQQVLQSVYGEQDGIFAKPDELQTLIDIWLGRARSSVSAYIDSGGGSAASFYYAAV